ncbi:hypothetical protein KCP74_02975 [Salmonella enterica subsp. enterica]|nr:hypothetical protein KCP74_02975 [Salmonella enterica subsp. enterica]
MPSEAAVIAYEVYHHHDGPLSPSVIGFIFSFQHSRPYRPAPVAPWYWHTAPRRCRERREGANAIPMRCRPFTLSGYGLYNRTC